MWTRPSIYILSIEKLNTNDNIVEDYGTIQIQIDEKK